MRETAASPRQPQGWIRTALLTGVTISLAILPLVQARPAAADLEDTSRTAAKMAAARRDAAMKAVATARSMPAKGGPVAQPAPASKAKSPASAVVLATSATRGDPRYDEARRRYARVIGVIETEAGGEKAPPLGFSRAPDKPVLELDAASLADLIERSWRGAGRGANDPKRMIDRTRNFVAVARALRMDGRVGALQAVYGTPLENGLDKRVQAVEDAKGRLAAKPKQPSLVTALAQREAELEKAMARLPKGPKGGWATFDLDVNADGRIDREDVKQARAEREAAKQVAKKAPTSKVTTAHVTTSSKE